MSKNHEYGKPRQAIGHAVGIILASLAIASEPAWARMEKTGKSQPSPLANSQQPVSIPASRPDDQTAAPLERDYSFSEIIAESVTGDVYAEPSRWQALGYGNLFSKGWNKPWSSPPAGGGGAPRHGWMNAEDGVFYRLSIAGFGWRHGLANNSDGYGGSLTSYTPLSARLEVRTDLTLASDHGPTGLAPSQTNFGDFIITPRILLSESKEQTQTLDIAFRTPTGNSFNGNGYAAIAPTYNFWTNYWKGLVVRGGLGFSIPYEGEINRSGARSNFNANLAIGYYFTPHNAAPFGDLVFYVSNNLTQYIDNRGPASTTTFTIGPGFRSHLGDNWYLLGSADFAVTNPQPYDYRVLGGIMKVY